MKRRMNNTFKRLLKNKRCANILSNIGYGCLCVAYFVIKIFIKETSSLEKEDARHILNNCSKKPVMNSRVKLNAKSKDLSIIVPAYNASRTIGECIQSVINQKTKYAYELIIVNDGSKDNTREVIEKCKDDHVVLINQENKGFSGARNAGIDAASGNYIMFLDSDDYLIGECIESMMVQAYKEDADIVQASYYSFYEGSVSKDYSILKDRVIIDDAKDMMNNPGFPWGKLYKRELFDNLRFPLDVWFEDTIVSNILYRLCHKAVVMSDVVYAYRINPEGITKKARHGKKCVDHYWVMEFCVDKARELNIPFDKLQYEIIRSHMSTLLYRRISLMEDEIIESAFILAAEMLDDIRPDGYICKGNLIHKDIERAFINRNYKLWKLASFVI